jgi:hypothetical protein
MEKCIGVPSGHTSTSCGKVENVTKGYKFQNYYDQEDLLLGLIIKSSDCMFERSWLNKTYMISKQEHFLIGLLTLVLYDNHCVFIVGISILLQ